MVKFCDSFPLLPVKLIMHRVIDDVREGINVTWSYFRTHYFNGRILKMSTEILRKSDSSDESDRDGGFEFEGEDIGEDSQPGFQIKPYQFEPEYSSSEEENEESDDENYQRLTDNNW